MGHVKDRSTPNVRLAVPLSEDTLRRAIENSKNIIAKTTMVHDVYSQSGPYWKGNTHQITDVLIENAGRFCLNHSSDLLISLKTIFEEFENMYVNEHCHIFAMRECGVDHMAYFIARTNSPSERINTGYYRKIFAVTISESVNDITKEPELTVELKELRQF